jgi:glyoxylase-like metal-dependent hydrolase (beta-lactamase superfamily II)
MHDFARFESVRVGDARISFLADGGALCDPMSLFPASNEVAWSMYQDQLTDTDELAASVGGFLVEVADRRIVVDAGVGPVNLKLPPAVFSGGRFLESLERTGVKRSDVTDVVFTHLHADDCGWVTCGNGHRELTFPNAAHRVSHAEWEYWTGGHAEAERDDGLGPDPEATLGALSGLLVLVEDGDEIAPGVTVIATPGHTPGHVSLRVESNGERAILVGDTVYGPIHLLEPDWHVAFDGNRQQARESRRRIFRELAEPHTIGAGIHFPDTAFGQYIPSGFGQMWVPLGETLLRPA